MIQSNALPTGTITFLFTDIEKSTRLLQEIGEAEFRTALEAHNNIIRRAVESAGGVVVRTVGDAFFAAFVDARDATAAAVAAQLGLADPATEGSRIAVRIGLHTGRGAVGGDDYVGIDVHRAARIADAANGGQTLLSATTAALVGTDPPAGSRLRSLGDFRLKDLSEPEPLYQLDIDGLANSFPPLRTIRAGNLPVQLTSFVGRSKELARLGSVLEDQRLITLTGPGGTGKTRLSIQAAAESADGFDDGAFFVSLEGIESHELIGPAILDALEVPMGGSEDPLPHLIEYLTEREVLLVLDNVEQIDRAAAPITELLERCSRLKILVTSRAPLHVPGEQEYPVPPLAIPDAEATPADVLAGYDGVELFTERAMAVRPDFELTDKNASVIATLAARLDGLPLAIELAASRVKSLEPAEILGRLSNRLLANPANDLPERQRTMANAIGWSYDLLDEPARRLFEECSVFIGGATLDDVERVALADDVIDAVASLVDHSLLRLVRTDNEPRYQMLVVVREFAYAALTSRGDDDVLRHRHALVYSELVERAAPYLLTGSQASWFDRLAADHDNVRAALEFADESSDTDMALAMVAGLWRFWQARGHLVEGEDRIRHALALEGGDPLLRARALEAAGGVAYWRGSWSESRRPYEDALALYREHGSPSDVANALYNASFPIAWTDERDRARSYLEEALEIGQAVGDRLAVGRAYWGLCDLASYREDYEETKRYGLEAERIFAELDAPYDLGWSRFMLAWASFYLGELSEARAYHASGLRDFAEVRDLSALMLFVHMKISILVHEESRVTAARLLGGAEALNVRTGIAIVDVQEAQFANVVALQSDASPDVQQAIESGRSLSTEELIDLALNS